MMHIRSRIEKTNDIPSEDEILFERLKRFDTVSYTHLTLPTT